MNPNLVDDLRSLTKYTSNLEEFLEVDSDKANRLKEAVKLFYDNLKRANNYDINESTATKNGVDNMMLSDLLIEDFDDEQIYQQIQLHFNATNSGLIRNLSKFITNADKLTFNLIDFDESSSSGSENEINEENVEEQNDNAVDEEEEDGEGEEDEEVGDDEEQDGENDEDLVAEEEGQQEAIEKKVRFQSNDLFGDDVGGDDGATEEAQQKSSFELRQDKLNEKIEQIHGSMLDNFSNKPWQLKGEVSAKTRPQESLIEEFLQFDHTTKQMPLNTEELTKKIENIIKTRIKDRAYDDVERKIRPVDMPNDYRKEVALNHEKSKQSLSQIYEQDYLNKTETANKTEKVEKVNPKHEEIRTALQSLFVKLDALSNFHFKPRPQINDFKIQSNIATVSVENVAPVHVSNTNMLAPSEIHDNINKLPKTSEEKDKSEKKRDLKEKRSKLKKLKIKQNKNKPKDATVVDVKKLKNVKKLSTKPLKVDANQTLQVFNPTSKRKSDAKSNKQSKKDNLSSKRLKI